MAEEKQNGKTVYPDPEDPELDDLLDDCLEDFNKNDTINKKGEEAAGGDDTNEIWDNEFMKEQAKMMESLLSGETSDPEALAKGFQKMAEMANLVLKGDEEKLENEDPEISASINEVLEKLSMSQEAAQNQFSAENLASMFQNLDASGEGGDVDAFLPFMQSMMQSLLSPDILLPSLKEIAEKYPGWLETNGSKLETTEKERYQKQLKLMQEVISELEKETPTDSSEVRQSRFNVVLEKMQKMQDFGQPPEDLLAQCVKGDASAIPGFDPNAVPADCNVM